MTTPQILILLILAGTVGLFFWGRWRHDVVALAALLACVAAGLVPPGDAFAGFGHPAVITVACVLVLSRGLQTSGAIDILTRRMMPLNSGPTFTIAVLTTLGAVLSAFMNNIGALALLMPVALQVAARQKLPAGRVLMPLAFGSILGGMTTLIGTPPNLIVSAFRSSATGRSFSMFDFSPVGLAVAGGGVLFVALVGWRLVPARTGSRADSFETGSYLTEARVGEDSKSVNQPLGQLEKWLGDADAQIVGLVRNDIQISAPHPGIRMRGGDILVIEAEPDALPGALSSLGLKLEEAVPEAPAGDNIPAVPDQGSLDLQADAEVSSATPAETGENAPSRSEPETGDIGLSEVAILPASNLTGRSATDIDLRSRFGINLLAISRQGRQSKTRLRTTRLQAGDVLLLQGRPEALAQFAAESGCVPLAERAIRLPNPRQALTASAIMLGAIAAAAFGLVPAAIGFAGGMLMAMITRVVPPRSVYDAIDWPVIVLLGALIPVAGALATTGAADLIAQTLVSGIARGEVVLALGIILVVTMTLSDFMNNAATAAVMCPIAIGTATGLGASIDPFLMAVAIGAACAFLTPIGHQNNTLILGPGGFRFGDYWRLGLPLEILVVAVSLPMLLWIWPP